jgi:gamma-glutamyltranspeptidase/glutathione hydrolase
MGGHMQPQGHLQVVRALVDLGLPPQSALDLPRWQWREHLTVDVEEGWPTAWLDGLRGRGHDLAPAAERSVFGRGQIILRLPGGGYAAASDRRADGRAAGV